MNDARVAAWLSAWEAMKGVRECEDRAAGAKNADERREYRLHANHIRADARVFSVLASVSQDVGWVAGEMLERQQQAEAQSEALRRKMKADMDIFRAEKDRKQTHPNCTCDWSRAACPVHPWPPEEKNDAESEEK